MPARLPGGLTAGPTALPPEATATIRKQLAGITADMRSGQGPDHGLRLLAVTLDGILPPDRPGTVVARQRPFRIDDLGEHAVIVVRRPGPAARKVTGPEPGRAPRRRDAGVSCLAPARCSAAA